VATARALVRVAACACLGLAQAANADLLVPDGWISAKLKLALLGAPGVSATHVNVDTVRGRVTLHGIVATEAARSAAEALARDIDGARQVRNLLQTVPPAARADLEASDSGLAARVSSSLEQERLLADADIEVASVNNGVVLLTGEARSLADSLRAIEVAAQLDGVRRVASQVTSADVLGDGALWDADRINASATASRAGRDRWITRTVSLRLVANTRISRVDTEVATRDGAVTLFGVVDSQALKSAAGDAVDAVDGVKAVVNELQVVAPGRRTAVSRSDASLDRAVRERLRAEVRLRASDIDVRVRNGVARLAGSVADASDRRTALALTRSTPGVHGVVEALEVRTAPPRWAR
jgi:hyperosmotically inducible protein